MLKSSPILIVDAYNQGKPFRNYDYETNTEITVANYPFDRISFYTCRTYMFWFSYEP